MKMQVFEIIIQNNQESTQSPVIRNKKIKVLKNQFHIPSFFSDLPTENWNDIFGFLPRTQLAQLVPQIGDRHFASKAQFYLHECGKITLGNLEISSIPVHSEDEDGDEILSIPSSESEDEDEISSIPSAEDRDERVPVILKDGRELPLADVPIPANIKNFKQIRIRFT
jgi:hypothetical protein